MGAVRNHRLVSYIVLDSVVWRRYSNVCLRLVLKQEVLRRRRPDIKRRVQQFYRCLCVRSRGSVSTELFRSNERKDIRALYRAFA
jgi:hypothetical protein